jgi:hypothetical protein
MGELLRRRELILRAAAAPGINDYVHDSMLLWLDGVENTRNGHDASATKWEDLSGNARDYTYHASSVIADKYCQPNGGMTTSVNLEITEGCTIEVVVRIQANGVSQMITAQGGQSRFTTWVGSGGNFVFGAGGASKYCVPPKAINTFNSSHYVNGAPAEFTASSGSWSNVYRTRLFAYSSNTNRPCVSDIYALRVYSRELTAAEVRHNFEIDKLRFGSGED